jgi:ABC-type polysaccharide/polyol phosphate transport system ATPase subunit
VPEPVVSVQGLWKEYALGARTASAGSIREAVGNVVAAPWRRLKRLRGHLGDDERFWALRDVSFDIQEGEVVGIIGRNGAGKSTLLKILSRITAPTRGRAEICGRVASLLEVGTGFHPELTGRENIFLNGAILGMRRQEVLRKFDAIVAFAEVERFLDTPVKRYSSGMYVRLAFAVAAHLDPEVLIVDEVLAVGDAAFQARCLGKMGEVAKGGRTILFVSHNMAAVKALCQRGILLDGGIAHRVGSADDVVAEYVGTTETLAMTAQERFPVFSETHCVGISACKVLVEDGGGDTQNLIVRLSLRATKAKRGLGVGFWLRTRTGVLVSSIAPAVTKNAVDLSPGDHWCEFRVERINEGITGGHYIVGIWLGIPGAEVIVRVDEAAFVSIRGVDVYGSGVSFDERFGVVPLRASFRAEDDASRSPH